MSKQNIDENNRNKKISLDKQSQKNINDLTKLFQLNFDSYKKEYKDKNNTSNKINISIDNEINQKDNLMLCENELEKKLEEKKLELKQKPEEKFEKEMEIIKRIYKMKIQTIKKE